MKRNKFLVKKTMSFITTTSDPRPLLASLQDTITSHFLAKEGQGGTVGLDRPGLQPLLVDREGVLLLIHAREGLHLGLVRLSGDGDGCGDYVVMALMEIIMVAVLVTMMKVMRMVHRRQWWLSNRFVGAVMVMVMEDGVYYRASVVGQMLGPGRTLIGKVFD